ncbi:hypothetical protein B0H10DRAFT_359799 [Mycena sp. CBHHK59/15]|nr:hypothetical protein B0H10DRAFT_599945 [Mycena sp. CBHHK59/15]KAJ6611574.1 hypothetical protein B0H10DRAFT_359799 [Mycena sp. CBHHK59/15]
MSFYEALGAPSSHIAGLRASFPLAFLPDFHLAPIPFPMHTRARLRLNEPDPQDEPTVVVAAPDEDPDSLVDTEDTDDDIADLPQEKRIQLAVAVTQGKLMSERKASIYYGVPRTTMQRRAQGVLTRQEAHIHERRLTPRRRIFS